MISQDSHAPDPRNRLLEELELLPGLLWVKARHAGEVSARPLQAWYQIVCYRIDYDREHHRNARHQFLGSPSRDGTRRDDDVHLETEQFGKKFGKSLILPFRESRLDDDVLAIDVT